MFILLVLLIAAFSGATNPIFIRFATQEIPPITFSAARFLLATVFLLPFWYRKKEFIAIRDFYKILPYTLNVALYAIGIQFTSVIMGSMFYTLTPILSGFLGYLMLKEKLSKVQLIGAMVALLGTGFLMYGSIVTSDILSFGKPLGNIIIFVAACLWGFYPIGVRSLSKSYSANTILFYTFTITGFLLLAMSPIEWLVRPLVIQSISGTTVLSAVGTAFIGTLLYYFLYQWLIKHTTVFMASLVLYAGFVTASFYGIIFLAEHLTIQLIFGSFLVLFGVFVATSYRYIKKRVKPVTISA